MTDEQLKQRVEDLLNFKDKVFNCLRSRTDGVVTLFLGVDGYGQFVVRLEKRVTTNTWSFGQPAPAVEKYWDLADRLDLEKQIENDEH